MGRRVGQLDRRGALRRAPLGSLFFLCLCLERKPLHFGGHIVLVQRRRYRALHLVLSRNALGQLVHCLVDTFWLEHWIGEDAAYRVRRCLVRAHNLGVAHRLLNLEQQLVDRFKRADALGMHVFELFARAQIRTRFRFGLLGAQCCDNRLLRTA